MGVRVIANTVARIRNSADQISMRRNIDATKEESGANVVAAEYIQDRTGFRARPIIERQGDQVSLS